MEVEEEEVEEEKEGSLEGEVEVGTAHLVHPRLRKYSRFVSPIHVASLA